MINGLCNWLFSNKYSTLMRQTPDTELEWSDGIVFTRQEYPDSSLTTGSIKHLADELLDTRYVKKVLMQGCWTNPHIIKVTIEGGDPNVIAEVLAYSKPVGILLHGDFSSAVQLEATSVKVAFNYEYVHAPFYMGEE